LEKQPLLSDKNQQQKTYGSIEESGSQNSSEGEDHYEDADHDEWDSTHYDISLMTSWRVFAMMKGAVFYNPTLWRCMTFATILAGSVAAATHLSVNSVWMNPAKIQKMGTFLNVFVGLLLGFFLSSSMNRWYDCVNAFLQLLDAVRNMHMQMIALGVDRERCEELSRYGILSVWLLHLSLNNSSEQSGSDKKLKSESSQLAKTWAIVEKVRPHLVEPEEKKLLLHQKECYALLWTWVSSLIGRMSQDGEIPPMASPTYGRIIEIVEMAYGSIRDVRVLHLVKAPFIYVHTLAILVHLNHILNATSFGLVMGITTQVLIGKAENKLSDLPQLLGSLFMQFCMSFVAPFLYLALLNVCVCISQPFTYQDAKIPALRFIHNLEEDIGNATVMADNTKWQKPRFKK